MGVAAPSTCSALFVAEWSGRGGIAFVNRFWLLETAVSVLAWVRNTRKPGGRGGVANTSSGGTHRVCGWVIDACCIFGFRFFVSNPLLFGFGSVECVDVRFRVG